jgi:hypothetical protein
MYRLSIIAILFLAGCAFRSDRVPTTMEPYYNLYSRNFVVAAPTAAANGVCGVAGGVALGLLTAHEGGFYAGGVIGAHACGSVVGLPFIPLSYLCEENPWSLTTKGKFKTTWTCDVSVLSSSRFPRGHSQQAEAVSNSF